MKASMNDCQGIKVMARSVEARILTADGGLQIACELGTRVRIVQQGKWCMIYLGGQAMRDSTAVVYDSYKVSAGNAAA